MEWWKNYVARDFWDIGWITAPGRPTNPTLAACFVNFALIKAIVGGGGRRNALTKQVLTRFIRV